MKNNAGIQMSEEELAEYNKAFSDIEESIELVMENGEDLWENVVSRQARLVFQKRKQTKR